jgi:hypothetical protein
MTSTVSTRGRRTVGAHTMAKLLGSIKFSFECCDTFRTVHETKKNQIQQKTLKCDKIRVSITL